MTMKRKKLNWVITKHYNGVISAKCRIPHSSIWAAVIYRVNTDRLIIFRVYHGHHKHDYRINCKLRLNRNEFESLLLILDEVYSKMCYKKKLGKRGKRRIFCKLLRKPAYNPCDDAEILNGISNRGVIYEI